MTGLLSGKRMLVVEDEALIALMVREILAELDMEVVGPCGTVGAACAVAQSADFDCAILDLNLGGMTSYAVADIVIGRGIPVIISTGMGEGGILEDYRHIPVLKKPFFAGDVIEAVSLAFGISRVQ